MKLADGREFETRHAIEGVRYNLYDCPGDPAHGDRVEDGTFIRGRVVHRLLSMDVDEGVTPFIIGCPDHDHCDARSEMYPIGIERHPSLWPVRLIWRKPTAGERKRERRMGGSHYAQGGLAREWTTSRGDPAPSWVTSGRHG